jgi:hypothetical protein
MSNERLQQPSCCDLAIIEKIFARCSINCLYYRFWASVKLLDPDTEPVFVDLLRSPGIDSQPGAGRYDNPSFRTGLPGYIGW